jgi:hypothetical protein
MFSPHRGTDDSCGRTCGAVGLLRQLVTIVEVTNQGSSDKGGPVQAAYRQPGGGMDNVDAIPPAEDGPLQQLSERLG